MISTFIIFGVPIALLLVFSIKAKAVLSQKNILLLDALTKAEKIEAFDSASVKLGSFNVAEFWKVYFVNNAIVLIENSNFHFNRRKDSTSKSYLIRRKHANVQLPDELFENLCIITDIRLDKKDRIAISVLNNPQIIFQSIGFDGPASQVTVHIKLPVDKGELKSLLKAANLT